MRRCFSGTRRRFLAPYAAGLVVLFATSCASVPRESVELSATLGRDLAEVHRAHRLLAEKYFDRIRTDINQFIDEEYRPFLIEGTVEGFRLLEKLEAATQPGADPDALEILELFVTKLSQQIESYRAELLGNISVQEGEVLGGIDAAYQQLQNANSIVTGHLASVRKVQDVQARMLERTGLDSLSGTLLEKTVLLSDSVSLLVEKARRGEEALDELARRLEEYTRGESKDKN
ncbi:MAG: hypothetical protein AMS17_11285 [Spirochaetes bacterium DG_61]|jgi:hypothetical protein|nr:MAG: hypothetical protein AMS17_11285 [Spirochaetes bacterium DG_61]